VSFSSSIFCLSTAGSPTVDSLVKPFEEFVLGLLDILVIWVGGIRYGDNGSRMAFDCHCARCCSFVGAVFWEWMDGWMNTKCYDEWKVDIHFGKAMEGDMGT